MFCGKCLIWGFGSWVYVCYGVDLGIFVILDFYYMCVFFFFFIENDYYNNGCYGNDIFYYNFGDILVVFVKLISL